jgi:hypothetical protein
VRCRGLQRRQAGGEVLERPLLQREHRAVLAPVGEAPCRAARHLVGHADRAVEERPGVSVSRVEEVERLADEIGPAARVECRCILPAEHAEPLDRIPLESRVERLGGRRKEIGAFRAHLVEVDVNLRRSLPVTRDPRARLRLREPGPVAVQVETEVVRSPARPGRMVLARVGVRVGLAVHGGGQPGQVAHPPIGVHHRIDRQHDAAEELGGLRLPRRGQVVERRESGVGARRFVAVHPVGEPDENRHVGRGRPDLWRGRGVQGAVPHRELVHSSMVFGRRDRDQEEFPPFGRPAVRFDAHSFGSGRGDRAHIRGDLGVRREPVPDPETEDLVGSRNARIHLRGRVPRRDPPVGEERIVRRGESPRETQRSSDSQDGFFQQLSFGGWILRATSRESRGA